MAPAKTAAPAATTKASDSNNGARETKQIGLLTSIGAQEPVSGDFFKPDGKWRHVTILGARLPTLGDDPRYYEETNETRAARAAIWKNTERDPDDVGGDSDDPAWDPSGEAKNRPKRLPILALVDVREHNVDKVWEVTGARAFKAINETVTSAPMDVRVKTIGKGTDTTVVLEPAPEEGAGKGA